MTFSAFQGILVYQQACAAVPFNEAQCQAGMLLYLRSLSRLSQLWCHGLSEDQIRRMPWHMRPTVHMCEHLVLESVPMFGSPNSFHCYGDEDFVGRVKQIAQRCRHSATIQYRVLQKLMLRIALD